MHNIKEIRNDIESFKESLDKRFLNIDVGKILSTSISMNRFFKASLKVTISFRISFMLCIFFIFLFNNVY